MNTSVIDALLAKYGEDITCFCFMGGDREVAELERLATYIREHSDLKIGWYSGRNEMPPHPALFDFVKLGPYMADKGSLKSRTTNQRLYRRIGEEWEDITHRFWK